MTRSDRWKQRIGWACFHWFRVLALGLLSTISTDRALASPTINFDQLHPLLPFEKYQPGRLFCQTHGFLLRERGQFLTVPINYRSPAAGRTEIYFWFGARRFSPELPTVFILAGGFGTTSHDFNRAAPILRPNEWNEVYVDLRGAGCSRPNHPGVYADANFHNLEWAARDLDELRRALKLQQVSLLSFGASSAIAQIYTSLFQNQVRALVHEGVVLEPAPQYFLEATRLASQVVFDWMSPSERRSLLSLEPTNLIKVIHALSYFSTHQRGLAAARDKLRSYFNEKSEFDSARFLVDYQELARPIDSSEAEAIDTRVLRSLECKYFAGRLGRSGQLVMNIHQRLQWSLSPIQGDLYCRRAGITPGLETNFSSRKWPHDRPTTYFQGEWDFHTPIPLVRQHFQSRVGPRQLLIQLAGTSMAVKAGVMSQNLGERRFWADTLGRTLLGAQLSDNDIRGLAVFTSLPWNAVRDGN